MPDSSSRRFVRSLPADVRGDMVREWEEALRAIDGTIATAGAALEADLEMNEDDGVPVDEKPDFDELLKSLQELASLRARRNLLAELLELAAKES
jgi:hypothetical protein